MIKFYLPAFFLLTVCLCLLPGSPANADEQWGPFQGRFIDVDTDEPIPGAVAIVIWLQDYPGPVHEHIKFYDARVAVAKANGEFEISRRESPFFTFGIETPRFDYAAPGYVLWNLEEVWKKAGVVKMKRQDSLSRAELIKRLGGTGRAGMISDEKRDELLKIVNAAREKMRLKPMDRLRE